MDVRYVVLPPVDPHLRTMTYPIKKKNPTHGPRCNVMTNDPIFVYVGWPGALATALNCFMSPFNILLERKFRRRTIVLAGVVIYCAGLLMTSFVPALGYTYLTFGVLAGVGMNFMTQPPIALLLDWFAADNYSRALALALLGSTLGKNVRSFLPFCAEGGGNAVTGFTQAQSLDHECFFLREPKYEFECLLLNSLTIQQEVLKIIITLAH